MKALIAAAPGGLDHLRIVDRPDPGNPGAGEIRVRLHANSLNYHDLGVSSAPRQVDLVPMADGAGVIEAIGPDVRGFAVGDPVVSTFFPSWLAGTPTEGSFATTPGDGIDGFAQEYVVRPAHAFTLAPRNLTHAEASTITTAGTTAWRALVIEGGIKPGDTVLVLGTGGVSIWALQIAHAIGARVIATSSSDSKLARARELGAWETINYRTTPNWSEMVLDLTGGRGVDHVVEVGGSGTLSQSIAATRVGGHIALIGVLAGGATDMRPAIVRQVRITGLVVGSNRDQTEFVTAIEALDLHPVIDRTFPLEELPAAFRLQQDGGHFGKIVVEF